MFVKKLLGAVCALTIVCASFSVVSADTSAAGAAVRADQLSATLPFIPRNSSGKNSTPMQLAKRRCAGLGDPCTSSRPCCAGMTCIAGFAEGKPGAWCDNSQ